MDANERPSKIRKLDDGDISLLNASSAPPEHEPHSMAPNQLEKDIMTVGPTLSDHITELPEPCEGAQKNYAENEEEDGRLPAPEKIAPSITAVTAIPGDPPLSKAQQKKLRKKAEWESKRDERKIIRKEKQVAKRERKRAARQQEAEANPDAIEERYRHKRAVQLPVSIIVDCDFDDLMLDGERVSLAAQITRCYSDNKKSPFRAHLTICSFGGKLRERFDTVLNENYKSFKGVRTFDCDFVETSEKATEWMSEPEGGKLAGAFSDYTNLDDESRTKLKEQGEVVYLTSEADDDLNELKPYSTYIIGGLVDRNREKGICYKRATTRGVKTAKLPIGEFMEMQSRKVLTTNHVNEIMLKWLECGDWGEAFTKVIPKRKGGKLKETNGRSKQPDGDDADGNEYDDGDELQADESLDSGSQPEQPNASLES